MPQIRCLFHGCIFLLNTAIEESVVIEQEVCANVDAAETDIGFFINDGADRLGNNDPNFGGQETTILNTGETATCSGFETNKCGDMDTTANNDLWVELRIEITAVSKTQILHPTKFLNWSDDKLILIPLISISPTCQLVLHRLVS